MVDQEKTKQEEVTTEQRGRITIPRTPHRVALNKPDNIGVVVRGPGAVESIESDGK